MKEATVQVAGREAALFLFSVFAPISGNTTEESCMQTMQVVKGSKLRVGRG